MRKAVIVAAGMSSRLYPLTLTKPKGLLTLNDETLLGRSISLLKKYGITDIALVVGYKQELMRNQFGSHVSYIENIQYESTNNMFSLNLAQSFVGNDEFIYLHGDIAYEEEILARFLEGYKQSTHDMELLVDYGDVDEEAMKVKVTNNQWLVESHKEIALEESAGEWTGIACIRRGELLFSEIDKIIALGNINSYDTLAFTNAVAKGYNIYCRSTVSKKWIEIDFLSDYEKAKGMFANE